MQPKPSPNNRALRLGLAAGGVLVVVAGAFIALQATGGALPLLGSREDLSAAAARDGKGSSEPSAEGDALEDEGEPGSELERRARARRAARNDSDGTGRTNVTLKGASAAALGVGPAARDSVRGSGEANSGSSAQPDGQPGGMNRPADGSSLAGGVVLGRGASADLAGGRRAGGDGATGDGAVDSERATASKRGAAPFSQGSPTGVVGPGGEVCGDGVRSGTEECEPSRSPTCSDDCVRVLSDECYACAQETACIQLANSCLEFTANEGDQTVCYDVMKCVQDSGCANNPAGLTSCFCGSLTTSQCVAAPPGGDEGPDGPCADVIRQATHADNLPNSVVLTRYLQRDNPAGIALRYLNCLKSNANCAPICFPH
jgi:hypothetical protein